MHIELTAWESKRFCVCVCATIADWRFCGDKMFFFRFHHTERKAKSTNSVCNGSESMFPSKFITFLGIYSETTVQSSSLVFFHLFLTKVSTHLLEFVESSYTKFGLQTALLRKSSRFPPSVFVALRFTFISASERNNPNTKLHALVC